MKILRHISATAAILSLASGMASAAPQAPGSLAMKASLDSAVMEMGRQTTLHLEVVGNLPDSVRLELPDSIWQEVEVSHVGPQRFTDLGNGRRQMLSDITIQSFDSGVYTLPPVLCIVGEDTFISNRPVLKVLPCNVDTLKTIHDYADVLSPKRQLTDYVPDWFAYYGWWILLILAALGFGIYYWMRSRKGKPVIAKPVKVEPPYEVAKRQLEELRAEGLCERGQEKLYYTRLTDILRIYLRQRFGINAMEMTSTQIRHAIRHNEATRMSEKLIDRILEMADFVKFAKVRPLPDDNVMAMNSAMKFVDDTRPVETPSEEAAPDAGPNSDSTPNS